MDYFCYWCKSQRSLEGYTVIITGCNTGIGKETCLDLYKRGIIFDQYEIFKI